MSKPKTCYVHKCKNKPYQLGLCEKHYTEKQIKEDKEKNAIQTLHFGLINETEITDKNLKEELALLRKWWDCVGKVLMMNKGTKVMPLDEALFAQSWCISLAQEIIDAELATRKGERFSQSLDITREWVWDRFKNLEAGLRSNGTKRD